MEQSALMNDILPAHQFGFRPRHSTTHQLQRVAEQIISGFEGRKYTAGVFLDVASAFDTVWHAGLLHKLRVLENHRLIPHGKNLPEARHYFKEVVEKELCPGLKPTDYTAFPGYPNMFYSCEVKENLAECNKEDQRMTSFKNKEEHYENFLLGRLSGKSGCLYMKLYQCPLEHQGTTCPPPRATSQLVKSSDTLQLG